MAYAIASSLPNIMPSPSPTLMLAATAGPNLGHQIGPTAGPANQSETGARFSFDHVKGKFLAAETDNIEGTVGRGRR